MEFLFHAGGGWDDLSAKRAVEMINHSPPSIEGLVIRSALYGLPFMDGLIDWIEKKSTNLKYLEIYQTCVCGRNGGRDTGIILSNIGSQARNQISLVAFNGFDGIQECG